MQPPAGWGILILQVRDVVQEVPFQAHHTTNGLRQIAGARFGLFFASPFLLSCTGLRKHVSLAK